MNQVYWGGHSASVCSFLTSGSTPYAYEYPTACPGQNCYFYTLLLDSQIFLLHSCIVVHSCSLSFLPSFFPSFLPFFLLLTLEDLCDNQDVLFDCFYSPPSGPYKCWLFISNLELDQLLLIITGNVFCAISLWQYFRHWHLVGRLLWKE